MRKDGTAWRVFRITPSTGAEEALGTLPFRPQQALSSPSRAHVLYLSAGRGLAVLGAASGTLQRFSVSAYPLRSIDGATWISEQRFVFGGSRKAYASPEFSSLYMADLRTSAVSRFRRLSGGEPSYAAQHGSLIYVTRRSVGDTAKEAIWRLRSLTARPRVLTRASAYVDAGRSFNTPLLSPDGSLVLSARTGTDVSATYRLLDASWGATHWALNVQAVAAATWGGSKAAFVGSRDYAAGGPLVIFVYDAATGSVTACPTPQNQFSTLAFSGEGDLVVGAFWWPNEGVYAAKGSDLASWVKIGEGLVPVWVD